MPTDSPQSIVVQKWNSIEVTAQQRGTTSFFLINEELITQMSVPFTMEVPFSSCRSSTQLYY